MEELNYAGTIHECLLHRDYCAYHAEQAGYLINEERGYKHPCRGNKAKFMIAGWYHKNPDGSRFPLKFVEA